MLVVKNLTKEFRTKAAAVTALTVRELTVMPGDRLALSGPSGSGKTTLLNILAGLIPPTQGSVEHDGQNLFTLKESARDAWRAQNVGYVFQKLNLLGGLSALENVMVAMALAGQFSAADRRQQAVRLLTRVGLGERLDHKPRQLSLGEQQRVAVARATANRPKLILADEPTASLDAENSVAVLSLLEELAADTQAILIIATHDSRVRDRCAKIVKLCQGEEAAL